MPDNLYKMLHAGTAAIMATLSMAGTLLTQTRVVVVVITPPAQQQDQTAIVSNTVVPVPTATTTVADMSVVETTSTETSTVEASTISTTSSYPMFEAPMIKPGLLPIVKITKFAAPSTSTTSTAENIPTSTIKIVAKPVVLKPIVPVPPPAPAPTPKPAPAPTSTPIPSVITAQWLLAQTSASFSQRLDGTYKVAFTTDLGNGKTLPWDLTQTVIGGTHGIPQFTLSYSCTPQPSTADPNSLDQSLSFAVRTPYDCTVSLTPQSGADQRMQSKDFSFTTGVGRLVVTPASSMNTLLHDDENDGGFLFTNQENTAVTLTGITMDVSYTGLTTINGALVLRIADPANGNSLFDFHLENVAADTSSSYTHSQPGIPTPITFTIPANSARLLPFQVLGVHRQLVSGVDPTVTVTLRVVTANPTDTKVTLNAATISWQCIVGAYSFDPNATDLASANACKN